MRDPELVARAQRAATRLESAWEQWRALHGLAVAPGQPVVSYVGYSLKEPWGNPGSSSESTLTRLNTSRSSSIAMNASSGCRFPSSRERRAELPPEGSGEHARSALLGTPVSYGRHLPDQVRDMATELSGWNPGELPGQVTDQLAAWPPGPQTGADQPPTSA